MPCISFGVVHAHFECQDCRWTTESYKNAQAIAALHAKRTGHTVQGELGYSCTYGP